MTSRLYVQLVKQARRRMLSITWEQQREILHIYEGAIMELAEQVANIGEITLDSRWRANYLEKTLRPVQRELSKQLKDGITGAMQRAGTAAVQPDIELFERVLEMANLDLGPHFTEMFSAAPNEALQWILRGDLYRDSKGLSERIWRTSSDFGQTIDYILKRGIAEKKSAVKLAKDLEQFLKPESARPWSWGKVYPGIRTKQVDFNAQRLARTSITHAHRESQYASAERNPFVDAIHWELSDQHYERQIARWGPDECDDYATQDDYGLGVGNFPKGEVPMSHPMCLCTTMPVVAKSLDAIAGELRDWARGGNNPTLDEWYRQYGEYFAKKSA